MVTTVEVNDNNDHRITLQINYSVYTQELTSPGRQIQYGFEPIILSLSVHLGTSVKDDLYLLSHSLTLPVPNTDISVLP